MEYDLIIENGRIVDGTGNPWYRANIGIKDGTILKINRQKLGDSKKIIDASKLAVAPSFVDLHSHGDMSISIHNKALNYLHMGVGLIVTGQCGSSSAPITEEFREQIINRIARRSFAEPETVDLNWLTLNEYRQQLEKIGLGVNIAHLCGHNTIRSIVMGLEGEGGERHIPTTEEMDQMKSMVAQAMEDGAFGMSSGLRYAPSRNATTKEVIDLCNVVAKYGGIFMCHMRSEEDKYLAAVKEVIEIGEKSNIPVNIAHHKAIFAENWGKPLESIRIIHRARERGVDVISDSYPYLYGGSRNMFNSLLMKTITGSYYVSGEIINPDEFLEQIKDDKTWETFKSTGKDGMKEAIKANMERKRELGKHEVIVPDSWIPDVFENVTYSKTRPDLVNKNFYEVGQIMNKDDYWDAIRELWIADEGETNVAGGNKCEEDLIAILQDPASGISTDAFAVDIEKVPNNPLILGHPRGFGTYPRILGRYVREQKVLTLEEAIRKMTSLGAKFLGLSDRGLIGQGMRADITIFDPKTVIDKSTYAESMLYPEGIHYVLLNGKLAIEEGEFTDNLAGKVLFHK